jgi:hypothetical protein
MTRHDEGMCFTTVFFAVLDENRIGLTLSCEELSLGDHQQYEAKPKA